MSNDNRNMILAIVLSALVLFGWGYVSQSVAPTANPPAAKSGDGNQAAAPQPQASATPTAPRATRDRAVILRETAAQRIAIRTPRLQGSLNLRGARIDDLVLTTHREGIAADSAPIRLFSPDGTTAHRDEWGHVDGGAYFASFGWNGAAGVAPPADALWRASGGAVLSPQTPVTLTWDNGRGQSYRIVLRVDDGYLFTAEQTMTNRGPPVAVAARALVNRVAVTRPNEASSWTSHFGPVGVFNGSANYDNNFEQVVQAQNHMLSYDSNGGWIGFTDKYWLAAMIPAQGANVVARFSYGADQSYQADFSTRQSVIGTGATVRNVSHLFAGAKEIALLDRYSDSLGTDLGRAIDWGWFDFIMKPLFALLMWLFFQVGNFGVAIIFLVIIVRLILFPLAQKQFASMAKMRVLQPKVKALQERYAADKPRLQQEMMKLYKEEKVNPMAGCLPIFLQIPIFYALYKVLLIAVEMRHQPFALWIKDLTAPDPLTPINLFGLLPFQPPGFIAIGILPILVGVTMWLQQKMNSAPMDPTQAKIFAWMPWILVVIMAPFAAGFQVYWVTNNLISILQIWFLNRKMDAAALAGVRPGVALGKARAKPKAAPPPPPPSSPPPPSPRPPSPSRPRGRQKSRRR